MTFVFFGIFWRPIIVPHLAVFLYSDNHLDSLLQGLGHICCHPLRPQTADSSPDISRQIMVGPTALCVCPSLLDSKSCHSYGCIPPSENEKQKKIVCSAYFFFFSSILWATGPFVSPHKRQQQHKKKEQEKEKEKGERDILIFLHFFPFVVHPPQRNSLGSL